MSSKEKQTKITMLLPLELWEKIKQLAQKERRSTTSQVIYMLEKMLKQIEKEEEDS